MYLILGSAACLSLPLVAQAAPPALGPAAVAPAAPAFEKADAEKAVTELATALDDNFVFPEAGKKYAAMLRANLAAGKYASFPTAQAFAEQVTSDLQAVHKDGHLRIHPMPAEMRSGGPGQGRQRSPRRSAREERGRQGRMALRRCGLHRLCGFPGQ
jgi:hypothetical protein